ncbi:MAG: YgjV family protein [Pyrinomonadaceae bacterium]|nr:YgjV family protein [Pyrinomonadaceae bacterium]
MLSWIGWVATALFAASYFFKHPVRLRLVQALAALLWIVYGVAIAAPPVIVANVIVATIAATSAWRQRADYAK